MSELKVTGLAVEYGGITAVHDVSITIPARSIVTLLGANGAGKTSTVRAIMGLVRCAGVVALDDRTLSGCEPFLRVRAGLGYVPEGRLVFAPLTVAENLALGGYRQPRRAAARTLEEVYDLFPVLRTRAGQAAGSLSGGEQQMLAIGRALMGQPRFLLIDEPSMGLAPALARTVFSQLRKIADRGSGILIADQNAQRALAVADSVLVMRLGQIVATGTADSFTNSEDLARLYLAEVDA
jgi:branched-chain amino acid transport system ATP-binding protein